VRPLLIESAAEAAALRQAAGERVAVDCEAAGFHRYSDRLCLVQLSTERETFALDPFAFDLAPVLRPCLQDPGRQTIMHGASYDLRLLRRDLGIGVASLFDTQIAAALVGEPALGLQSLLERHAGVRLSKKFQRADWAKRPLDPEMIEYAAADTRYLHQLAAVLERALRRLGRETWAEEECQRLLADSVRQESQEAVDPVTRVKGARKLGPRTVTALRRALAWRDDVAREFDRAPFRVASDAALATAAAVRPRSPERLAALPGFRRGIARERGWSLVRALAKVDRMADRELEPYPTPKRRGRGRPPPEEEAAFERLKKVRDQAAERLAIDRGRVMANHVLRRLAEHRPASLDELEQVREVRRWQAGEFGAELLGVL